MAKPSKIFALVSVRAKWSKIGKAGKRNKALQTVPSSEPGDRHIVECERWFTRNKNYERDKSTMRALRDWMVRIDGHGVEYI